MGLMSNERHAEVLYHPSNDERNLSLVLHLLGILFGFLGPLIVWLLKKDESRYLDHHGKEALNFAFSVFVYSLGIFCVLSVFGIITLGFGFLVLLPAYFAFIVVVLVFQIIGCVRAAGGDWYRFPLIMRILS